VIHFLGVKKDWSRQRLVPTSICSLLSLIHFHCVFWKSPTSYPLLNYFPAFLESFLASATLLACGLNILTHILLEGAIRRPIFGHVESLAPKWDEDFSIVLLRLGTASLEATNLAGLGNEVGGISVPSNRLDPKPSVSDGQFDPPEMELGPGGVSSSRHRGFRGRQGFDNEIKNVRAISATRSGGMWVHSVWYVELLRFWHEVWKVAIGLWRLIRSGDVRARDSSTQRSSDVPERTHEERSSGSRTFVDEELHEDPYEAFLRGTPVSDDEEDYNGSPTSSSSKISGLDDIDDQCDNEAVGLYVDLSITTPAPAPPTVLLAHMTDTSSSPLTRRRYHRLVPNSNSRPGPLEGESGTEDGGDGDFWADYASDRRRTTSLPPNAEEQLWEETRRNCVICTIQQRQIICWPCRLVS
jgi:hypothetical protein